jgi:hypothetical protein
MTTKNYFKEAEKGPVQEGQKSSLDAPQYQKAAAAFMRLVLERSLGIRWRWPILLLGIVGGSELFAFL